MMCATRLYNTLYPILSGVDNGRSARKVSSLARPVSLRDDSGVKPIVRQVWRRVTDGNRRAELRPDRN